MSPLPLWLLVLFYFSKLTPESHVHALFHTHIHMQIIRYIYNTKKEGKLITISINKRKKCMHAHIACVHVHVGFPNAKTYLHICFLHDINIVWKSSRDVDINTLTTLWQYFLTTGVIIKFRCEGRMCDATEAGKAQPNPVYIGYEKGKHLKA